MLLWLLVDVTKEQAPRLIEDSRHSKKKVLKALKIAMEIDQTWNEHHQYRITKIYTKNHRHRCKKIGDYYS